MISHQSFFKFLLTSLAIILSLPGCVSSRVKDEIVPQEQFSAPNAIEGAQNNAELTSSSGTLIEPELYVIDISLESKVPSDLTEQLFSPMAGGMGSGGGDCYYIPGPAYWESFYDGSTVLALPRTLYWSATNLAVDPIPSVTLTLPDSSEIHLEGNFFVQDCDISFVHGLVYFSYQIQPGALLGMYKTKIEQGDLVLTDSVILSQPTMPSYMKYVGGIWFAGYQPGEEVRISFYYNAYSYMFSKPEFISYFPDMEIPELTEEWFTQQIYLNQSTVYADEYGSFRIQTISELPFIHGEFDLSFLVEGKDSVLFVNDYSSGNCQEIPPYRLEIGDIAIRTDFVKETMGWFFPEDVFMDDVPVSVVLGPICARDNNMLYDGWMWFVETQEGNTFFVSEVDKRGYYLEVIGP